MSIIDTILGFLAPYACLACGAEGSLMCDSCRRLLPPFPAQCYRCRRPASGAGCSDCLAKAGLQDMYAATAYSGIGKDLIWQLKSAGVQAASALMAAHMASLISSDDAVIVPVPTATRRIRRRGYDQAKLLAKELSRQTALPSRSYLVRSGQTHQVGASRAQRLQQLQDAFRPRGRIAAGSRTHILLVDDVLTTGATLEAAAACLRAHGVGRVSAVVFAQA